LVRCEWQKADQRNNNNQTTTTSIIASTITATGAIERQCGSVRGKQVLEIGAGLGLCGILAHHLGADRVLLTDGDTDALANLRGNVQRATYTTTTTRTTNDDGLVERHPLLAVYQLVWGRNIPAFVERHGRFDIVLGADVIYIPESIEPMWSSVAQLLRPNGIFLLSYTRRNVSFDLVLETATTFGFVWESLPVVGVILFFRPSDKYH
jgi:predicted nicotinamide N-methyase